MGNQDFGGTIPSNVSNQNVKEVVSDLYNFAVKYDDEKISIWGKATMDAEFIDITPDVGLNYDFVNFEENNLLLRGGISSGIAYNVFENTERLESTKGDLIWKSNGFSIDPLKRHEMYLSVDFDEYTESLEGEYQINIQQDGDFERIGSPIVLKDFNFPTRKITFDKDNLLTGKYQFNLNDNQLIGAPIIRTTNFKQSTIKLSDDFSLSNGIYKLGLNLDVNENDTDIIVDPTTINIDPDIVNGIYCFYVNDEIVGEEIEIKDTDNMLTITATIKTELEKHNDYNDISIDNNKLTINGIINNNIISFKTNIDLKMIDNIDNTLSISSLLKLYSLSGISKSNTELNNGLYKKSKSIINCLNDESEDEHSLILHIKVLDGKILKLDVKTRYLTEYQINFISNNIIGELNKITEILEVVKSYNGIIDQIQDTTMFSIGTITICAKRKYTKSKKLLIKM